MKLINAAFLLLALPAALCAGEPAKISQLDLSVLDRTADPCVDFYQYACGGWLAKNPVPADQSSWGRFHELAERNRKILLGILDKAAVADAKRDPLDQKIGDFYASCMDESKAESLGSTPLAKDIADINAMASTKDLTLEIAKLHDGGMSSLFHFGSDQDFKDATKVIISFDQGGLGLPDRDYYLKDDAKTTELRGKYLAHITKMFGLLGEDAATSAADAKTVLEFETELAKSSQDKVARRNPDNVYHRMSFEELQKLAPNLDWKAFFAAISLKEDAGINVSSPDFFRRASELLAQYPLSTWKTYMRWHLARGNSTLLSSAFVNENFDFYGKTLSGAKELRPRWKRCADLADDDLGEALGRKYVELTFGKDGKDRTLAMVKNIEAALGEDIKALDWMSPETKKLALKKLDAIENKIGYPEKWRDYSSVEILRGDALGNDRRASSFEFRRDIAKIGKPLDRTEWGMTPPTVNAYYNPSMNNINFPAGILQPPFFDKDLDDAVNYGAIGAVIGHEMTHGFDDQGRRFDGKGNLSDWWTENDAKEFEKRSACLVDQYSQYVATGDVKLNGKLTLGENTADNGGLRMSFMALEAENAGRNIPAIDGFTPEQRLFLGWGQVWCTNQTPEHMRLQALTDPHSLEHARVNGVLQNMADFAKAFSCKQGQPMVSANPCRIW